MVHYANADMGLLTPGGSRQRAEEAGAMAGFDEGFAARGPRRGRSPTSRPRSGLDYLGIDCAELADGRLLLFEGRRRMIVQRWIRRTSTRTSGRQSEAVRRVRDRARGSGDVAFVTTMRESRPFCISTRHPAGPVSKCAHAARDPASQMRLRKFL